MKNNIPPSTKKMTKSAQATKPEDSKTAPYREFLNKWAEETQRLLKFADGFDDAIIGVTEQNSTTVVCYNEALCVRILMDRDDMSLTDAYEFFHFNTKQAYIGEHTPVFVNLLQSTE